MAVPCAGKRGALFPREHSLQNFVGDKDLICLRFGQSLAFARDDPSVSRNPRGGQLKNRLTANLRSRRARLSFAFEPSASHPSHYKCWARFTLLARLFCLSNVDDFDPVSLREQLFNFGV
jgi:hypothetical protein